MKQPSVNIKNKRATFDYELMDTYTAGIVLTGTEIKSIRLGKASLVDTFCYFAKGELWVKNMHIAEYFYGSYNNHTARRDRKLLLNKKELEKIQTAFQTQLQTLSLPDKQTISPICSVGGSARTLLKLYNTSKKIKKYNCFKYFYFSFSFFCKSIFCLR